MSTLLESARTASPSAVSLFPRPRHHVGVSARRRADAASAIAPDPRSLVDAGRRQDAQARVDAQAQRIQAEIVPGDWEDWSEEDREAWLEENSIPRYLYPPTPAYSLPDGFVGVSQQRPQSRDGPARNTLPTPPHDDSIGGDRLFVPADQPTTLRRTSSVRRRHPLSRSWRPESPVNGLGDRNRSPTPADTWEVMRQTITADATLPSADSSFTSAAASLSFSASNSNNSASTHTSMTELDWPASSTNSRRNSNEDDESVSSVDPDNLVCDDDEIAATTAFAEYVYQHEQLSSEGQQRIARHSADLLESGQHRYAHRDDQRTVEVGFRLIDEALNTPEGRARVSSLSESLPEDLRQSLSSWINRDAASTGSQRRTRLEHFTDAAIAAEIHGRPDAGASARRDAQELRLASQRPLQSPPPYEPRVLSIQPEVTISTDEPLAHPVASLPTSPPSARSERDVTDALLSGDEEDLSAVRRIVERLAQRDDVPQEWWMSMGLNLSRTQVSRGSRARSPRREEGAVADAVRRVRAGRVERERGGGSRL